MLSVQHAMVTILACNNDKGYIEEYVPLVVFPDAIRAYSGARQYSHFERSYSGGKSSWWSFPTNIKGVTKDSVLESLRYGSYLAKNPKCVLGERTDINMFLIKNRHLPKNLHEGFYNHLIQDSIFDDFVRNIIDCSKMYEDMFIFRGNKLNGSQVRELIGNIEQQGVYVLAYLMYRKFGITCNNEWINSYLYNVLLGGYPRDLADKTIRFMKLNEDIDRYITNHDWSHMNSMILGIDDYKRLYNKVAKNMKISKVYTIEGVVVDNRNSIYGVMLVGGSTVPIYDVIKSMNSSNSRFVSKSTSTLIVIDEDRNTIRYKDGSSFSSEDKVNIGWLKPEYAVDLVISYEKDLGKVAPNNLKRSLSLI